MAVFPDRIVLKNSTDSQAAIEAAIGSGGTDAITQGELVLGLAPGDLRIYSLDGSGNVISFSPTSASGRAIVSDSPPTTGINGLPLVDGDLWYESDTGSYYVYYNAAWVEVSGGASALGDLTDVDLSTTPPVNGNALVYDGTNWVPGNGGGGSATLGRGDGGDLDLQIIDSAFVFGVYGGGDLDATAEDRPVELVSYDIDGGELT